MEYAEYKEKFRPLFVSNDWDGMNTTLEGTGPDNFPGPAEAKEAFKAYIDLGAEFDHSPEDLDAKLSEKSLGILRMVVAAYRRPSNPIEAIINRILSGGKINLDEMSTHRATEEMCRECESEDCEERKASYNPVPTPEGSLVH